MSDKYVPIKPKSSVKGTLKSFQSVNKVGAGKEYVPIQPIEAGSMSVTESPVALQAKGGTEYMALKRVPSEGSGLVSLKPGKTNSRPLVVDKKNNLQLLPVSDVPEVDLDRIRNLFSFQYSALSLEERKIYKGELKEALSSVNCIRNFESSAEGGFERLFFINMPTCVAPSSVLGRKEFRNLIYEVITENPSIFQLWNNYLSGLEEESNKAIDNIFTAGASSGVNNKVSNYTNCPTRLLPSMIKPNINSPDKSDDLWHDSWYRGFVHNSFVDFQINYIPPSFGPIPRDKYPDRVAILKDPGVRYRFGDVLELRRILKKIDYEYNFDYSGMIEEVIGEFGAIKDNPYTQMFFDLIVYFKQMNDEDFINVLSDPATKDFLGSIRKIFMKRSVLDNSLFAESNRIYNQLLNQSNPLLNKASLPGVPHDVGPANRAVVGEVQCIFGEVSDWGCSCPHILPQLSALNLEISESEDETSSIRKNISNLYGEEPYPYEISRDWDESGSLYSYTLNKLDKLKWIVVWEAQQWAHYLTDTCHSVDTDSFNKISFIFRPVKERGKLWSYYLKSIWVVQNGTDILWKKYSGKGKLIEEETRISFVRDIYEHRKNLLVYNEDERPPNSGRYYPDVIKSNEVLVGPTGWGGAAGDLGKGTSSKYGGEWGKNLCSEFAAWAIRQSNLFCFPPERREWTTQELVWWFRYDINRRYRTPKYNQHDLHTEYKDLGEVIKPGYFVSGKDGHHSMIFVYWIGPVNLEKDYSNVSLLIIKLKDNEKHNIPSNNHPMPGKFEADHVANYFRVIEWSGDRIKMGNCLVVKIKNETWKEAFLEYDESKNKSGNNKSEDKDKIAKIVFWHHSDFDGFGKVEKGCG